MSESFYRFLLRCYPASFRRVYAEEMMQLFRDRLRDEDHAFDRFRLWAELLGDFAMTLPRQHWRAYASGAAVDTRPVYEGPFRSLEDEIPSTRAFFAAVCVCIFVMALLSQGLIHLRERKLSHASPSAFHAEAGKAASSSQASSRDADHPKEPEPLLDEQRRVVTAVVAIVKQSYWDKAAAVRISRALTSAFTAGEDAGANNGSDFAALLNRQMRTAGGESDLTVEYSEQFIPERRPRPGSAENAQYAARLRSIHCAFSKTEVRQNGIGYLKLDWFADPSICGATARSAMSQLNDASILIYDLRENRGGDPEMVAFMAAYLFDHPKYLYNPREQASARSWTKSPVLAEKPVYILTSSRTLSGAEQFCYNLKALKRAVLVGETTGGAAHAGIFHRIDDHYGMGVPEVHVANPYGNANWEGIGVRPDVSVPADKALETVEQLVQAQH